MVGGALFILHAQVMDMLICSSQSRYAKHRGSYLIPLTGMRWARARGLRYFNWQGSPPGSGVYRFKRGWGSIDFANAYLTTVTGDVEPILSSTVEAVSTSYRHHYVVPYSAIGMRRDITRQTSSREDAYRAAEQSK